MEVVIRIFFFVAAIGVVLFFLTLLFSAFLIVWPFLAIALLGSAGYAWAKNKPLKKFHRSKHGIIIEHEDTKKD